MKPEIATGIQDFEQLREGKSFYIDKTDFIREWWNGQDVVTLITRPRRFGKTLNMSMMNCFFSKKYEGRGDLFEGLKVWDDPAMRDEQGQWPVIFLSFANIKGKTYESTVFQIKTLLVRLFSGFPELRAYEQFDPNECHALEMIAEDMSDDRAALSVNLLSSLLEKVYGKKVLIFLDEYDTPLQEAYINGYWDQLVGFVRTMFNSTFKTNPSLERAIMTGITRVSKESIFSDLNNLKVITTTYDLYSTCFGFTEEEVFRAMEEREFTEKDKQDVKTWYDGFTFGSVTDIYNPWSVINYLQTGKLKGWWANSSSNGLINKQLRLSRPVIKEQLELLLKGETLTLPIDEEIVFNQLEEDQNAIWSLMLASGYLKVVYEKDSKMRENSMLLTLAVTNRETMDMLETMVKKWLRPEENLSPFIRSMLKGDAKTMGRYLNEILLDTISYFDSGKRPSRREPENFYHGLVLGLVVENAKDYDLRSNRESGFGRYDVVMEPKRTELPAIIMEFKVFDSVDEEETMEDTAANALRQIEEMQYDRELLKRGIPEERILKYGLAFKGKECLVRKG